ncbi:MAG: hypothetical protein ACYDG4_17315 [Desulfuromonadaceae bacterium]
MNKIKVSSIICVETGDNTFNLTRYEAEQIYDGIGIALGKKVDQPSILNRTPDMKFGIPQSDIGQHFKIT